MPTAKPAGDRLRAPTVRDAKGVAALLRARELAALGVAETAAEGVRAEMAPAPPLLTRRFVPEHDAEAVWRLVQGAYADAEGIAGADLGERGGRVASRTGLITAIAVAPRARGRGRGRTLVALRLEAFRAKGLRYADAAAHGPTTAAARVFESAGMHVVRHTERWEKAGV